MKKKILFQTIIFLIIMSAIISSHQMVYADYSKLYPELHKKIETMTDEECEDVKICFYRVLDIDEVQERTKDMDTYEEKYTIIRSMYDEIITRFLHKYYVNDMSKVHKVDYSGPSIEAEATKSQILEFTEEKTVQLIYPEGLMQGTEGISPPYLLETKAAAMANILGHVNLSDYRIEQQQEIQTIIVETLENINQANRESYIREIVSSSESRLDAVKTDEQLKLEEQPNLTPPEDSEPDGDLSNSESKPTVTPSDFKPEPAVTPLDPEQNLTVTPSQPEQKPTTTPSKPEEALNAASQEKESTVVPTAIPSETDSEPTVTPQDEEITIVPTVTPQEKVSFSNGETESKPTMSKESETNRTLAAIALIALTAIIFTIIWFITKKRRLP